MIRELNFDNERSMLDSLDKIAHKYQIKIIEIRVRFEQVDQ
jgi:hypothetical protein